MGPERVGAAKVVKGFGAKKRNFKSTLWGRTGFCCDEVIGGPGGEKSGGRQKKPRLKGNRDLRWMIGGGGR